MSDARRLFSADSHCVITTEQVKQNLAAKFHEDWDRGMAEFDAQQKRDRGGQTLALEDFVDLEAATHPGYFDSKERLKAMDADGVECEVMYSEFDFTSKVYHVGERWKECASAYNDRSIRSAFSSAISSR
jgi:hypothetical protein